MAKRKYEPKPGKNEEFGFETYTGFHEDIQVNTQQEMSQSQYLEALERLRKIVTENELEAVDSTTPGDKYTECRWGVCSREKDLWPTPKLHKWPFDFLNWGRSAPINHKGYLCPMDTREEDDGQGCFYTCRVFQRKHKTPTREKTLRLIDKRIAQYSKER